MTCFRPSAHSRPFYRIRLHTGPKGERRSMSKPTTPAGSPPPTMSFMPADPVRGQPEHPRKRPDERLHRRARVVAHRGSAARLRAGAEPGRGHLVDGT
jgi:hypothetical protein